MRFRSRGLLRRRAIFIFSVAVILLVVIEDIFRFTGGLIRVLLPRSIEEFLKARSATFAFGTVGVALAFYIAMHVAEYMAYWSQYYWTGIALAVFSKMYFVSVLGYLFRVYSDRLLAVPLIKQTWMLYQSAKHSLESFLWYRKVHAIVLSIKAKVKTVINVFRGWFNGPSALRSLWCAIRRKKRA